MASQGAPKITVKLTANFEHNLADIEQFLLEADVPNAFDLLLDELTGTVIPNLERFPDMGRSFLERPVRSVEVSRGLDELQGKLHDIGDNAELREYILNHYVLLYARLNETVHLLSVRHHRQLSFDLDQIWN
ncbi:type II toxin-antitoxin system RelE/ParE family toxin [Uliginosibacterium sp. 31-16]|uniref:type II toxin-antitoxin system RelE/ParE family toxin n=1 Tax=Uliginosibacterium sp. 31-16 TaxID=3068315 RepID=UPI00273E88DF|nr:type II toxin-antitoxin system RelE/ParE family toxin [Uliginosibacterium sp. 31-16]MDP5239123.1 type II toxin-antitoxin system RelE/ParE family toxin [Uliginosibacterium sp. 31-16]